MHLLLHSWSAFNNYIVFLLNANENQNLVFPVYCTLMHMKKGNSIEIQLHKYKKYCTVLNK